MIYYIWWPVQSYQVPDDFLGWIQWCVLWKKNKIQFNTFADQFRAIKCQMILRLDTMMRPVKQEAQRATYRAPEYNVPRFWGISQGGHFCFLIGPKNTNMVEDIEILLPVKFRAISISGFRGEVENVSANQRPGQPSCFPNRPEKHKLGRGRWDLASWQV